MIIDCHGHYTTAPKQLQTYRDAQIEGLKDLSKPRTMGTLDISDDQIRESLEGAQLKFQRERGTDVTIFSPRASATGTMREATGCGRGRAPIMPAASSGIYRACTRRRWWMRLVSSV